MTLNSRTKPTIYDVALVAGVSHQTVSRVLNRPETVRTATRQRVLAVIAYLRYERNTEAERLGRLHKHQHTADTAE
jgi:DNA-binding LacI/PurR family transcriptional regulator